MLLARRSNWNRMLLKPTVLVRNSIPAFAVTLVAAGNPARPKARSPVPSGSEEPLPDATEFVRPPKSQQVPLPKLGDSEFDPLKFHCVRVVRFVWVVWARVGSAVKNPVATARKRRFMFTPFLRRDYWGVTSGFKKAS